jgi:hypothetical protein
MFPVTFLLPEKSEKMHLPEAQNALTSRDLIVALGWHSHLAGVDNELAKYWHLRFVFLSRALGLPSDWSEDRAKSRRSKLQRHAFASGYWTMPKTCY